MTYFAQSCDGNQTVRAVRMECPGLPGAALLLGVRPGRYCVPAAHSHPVSYPTPPPVFFETVGAEATGSSQLAATDYVTEPMEPKLKEETILLPLNSPNSCLCPGPPARLQRS